MVFRRPALVIMHVHKSIQTKPGFVDKKITGPSVHSFIYWTNPLQKFILAAASRFYQKYTWAVSCERTFVNLIAVFAEENETSGCWLGLQVIFSKNASILHQCHEAFLRSILGSTFNFLIQYIPNSKFWLIIPNNEWQMLLEYQDQGILVETL